MFIAVHGGAGQVCDADVEAVMEGLSKACIQGMAEMKSGKKAAEAVVRSINVLEDSPHFNAGYGSALNLEGYVECDASIMTSDKNISINIGAVTGVKNPITIARKILDCPVSPLMYRSQQIILTYRLISGNGALKAAAREGIEIVPHHDLISPKSQAFYQKRLRKPDKFISSDTVGAIAIDADGLVCAGGSSGGPSLKTPGRIGSCGIPGAGVWCCSHKEFNEKAGCIVTGQGEQITELDFARTFCRRSSESGDTFMIAQQMLSSSFNWNGFPSRFTGGFLSVVARESQLELITGFTTSSLPIAFYGSEFEKPVVLHLQKANEEPLSIFARSFTQ